MSKLNLIKFLNKEVLFLFVFFLYINSTFAQKLYSTYLIDIDTLQLNVYQINFYFKDGNNLLLKSQNKKVVFNSIQKNKIDSIKVHDETNKIQYKISKNEINIINDVIFLSPNYELSELNIISTKKQKRTIGISKKTIRKLVSNNEYSFIIKIPIDSTLVEKKIVSYNFYPTKAKSIITKQKVKTEMTNISPIIYQCSNVNCDENEKFNVVNNFQANSINNNDNFISYNFSDLNLILEKGNLFIGFKILSNKAAFQVIKHDKSNYECFIKNDQAPFFHKSLSCPKIFLEIM